MKKRILGILLCLCMVLGSMPATVFAATSDEDRPLNWTHSKSKTATNLNENFESEITLGLPSAEKQLVSDVVFVMDKSTSADTKNDVLKMLSNLKDQVSDTGAKVNVGVVIFNKIANVTPFKDLATEYDEIKAAIDQTISSGTNMHAGMLAGKEMLDDDTEVENSRKYLILISDGITYYYCKGGDFSTAYTTSALNGGDDGNGNRNCVPDTSLTNWDIKYGTEYVPDDWNEFFAGVQTLMDDPDKKDAYEYAVDDPNIPSRNNDVDKDNADRSIPYVGREGYLINADKSLYGAYTLYKEAAADYNCYAVEYRNSSYPFGSSFMDFLGGNDIDFTKIKNDILYFLDADSKVVDVMGKTDDYDFDFIDDPSKLSMKVGDKVFEAVKLDSIPNHATSAYGFDKFESDNGIFYSYVLIYYKNGHPDNSDEHFEWIINVPVTITDPVELTYFVKLMNPQKEPGTYGQYDRDGSQSFEELLTNNKATLYPVDSNKIHGEPEDFNRPTVSYTVEESPVSEPEQPMEPSDNNPQTGDNSNMFLWLALLFVSAAGLTSIAVCSRKKKYNN